MDYLQPQLGKVEHWQKHADGSSLNKQRFDICTLYVYHQDNSFNSHTHTHIYIFVCASSKFSFKHISLHFWCNFSAVNFLFRSLSNKCNIFVVLNKTDYANKLDAILHDTNKFTKINRNPINNLKIEVNKLISHINKQNTTKILNPIIGKFSPGCIYGTVKIHKDGNPLRPIILSNPYSYIWIN